MALSKPADDSALAMLRNSLHYFKATLCQFRICHDLCVTSNLLDEQSVKQLDQTAAEFRRLSTTVATLAEKVASVWCRTCLLFYRNIDKMKGNPAKVLNTISTQSKELSLGFEHVVKLAKQLAAKFQSIQDQKHAAQQAIQYEFRKAVEQLEEQRKKVQSVAEAQQFTSEISESTTETTTESTIDPKYWEETLDSIAPSKQEAGSGENGQPVQEALIGSFENRQREASEAEKKAVIEVERAQRKTKAAKHWADQLRSKKKWINAFPPLQLLLPSIDAQATAADIALEDAQTLERAANKRAQEAKRELDERTDQVEKAKVLASELARLMITLGQVEVICNLIKTFWSSQADYYGELAKNVTSPEELQENPNFNITNPQDMEKWLAQEKILLEKYHQVLTVVNSSYNFTSKCTPGDDFNLFLQPLSLQKLGLTLN